MSSSESTVVRIGTRASKLALWQANYVRDLMMEAHPEYTFELVPMKTQGDKNLNIPLTAFTNKGVFTTELDNALLNNEVDVVVHCVKDLATTLPDGIAFCAIMQREEPADCVILRPDLHQKYLEIKKIQAEKDAALYSAKIAAESANVDTSIHQLSPSSSHASLSVILPTSPEMLPHVTSSSSISNSKASDVLNFLPDGSVVGTSALRRQAQLGRYHPGLQTKDCRGNVLTRLEKLDRGDYDAIILAKVGIERLGLSDRISAPLDHDHYLHAVGQAALGIVCRQGDENMSDLFMHTLHNISSALACTVERGMLYALQGGCKVPIAVRSYVFALPSFQARTMVANIHHYNKALVATASQDMLISPRYDSNGNINHSQRFFSSSSNLQDVTKYDPAVTDTLSVIETCQTPPEFIRLPSHLEGFTRDNDDLFYDDEEEDDENENNAVVPRKSVVFCRDVTYTDIREDIIEHNDRPPSNDEHTMNVVVITRGSVLSLDGTSYLESCVAQIFPFLLQQDFEVCVCEKAWELGQELAEQLNTAGAEQILSAIRSTERH